MSETKPNSIRLRRMICYRETPLTALGHIFETISTSPAEGWIFLPEANEPLESIQIAYPALYNRLKDLGWEKFPDRRLLPPSREIREIVAQQNQQDTFESIGMEPVVELLKDLKESLEYYAHPDHYETNYRLEGLRPPGVLVEQGGKARQSLGKLGEYLKRIGILDESE